MEEVFQGKKEISQMGQTVGSTQSELDAEDVSKDIRNSTKNSVPFDMKDKKEGEDATEVAHLVDFETSGDLNMEASIDLDDISHAGGLGARDDISNFLHVASDSTDFEEALLEARDYEGPRGDVTRPGLGWTEGIHRKPEK